MNQKHTQGPWTWGAEYRGLYGSGPDNVVMTYADYENTWLAFGPCREANGHLIAAAPDLYEALKECSFRLATLVAATGQFSDIDAKALDAATAALAKAEGKP